MSTFTRKAFPPLQIGSTNRSGSVNVRSRANLVAKYNSQDDMLDAVEGLNLSDNMKLKFRLNIYQLYNNLKANAKVNNENNGNNENNNGTTM